MQDECPSPPGEAGSQRGLSPDLRGEAQAESLGLAEGAAWSWAQS